MSEAVPQKAGTIHDVGYQPYTGTRQPPSRRFLVIARNVIAVAWQQKWGVKLPVIGAIMVVIGAAVFMQVVGNRAAEGLRARGAPIPNAAAAIFFALPFLRFFAFIMAVTVACATIANDLKMGAFQFYFARPIRPRDYVGGKLLGLFCLIGLPLFACPVIMSIIRLLMVDDFGKAMGMIDIVPRAMALGLVGTAAFVLPAAGIGALMQSRVPAQALYAIYYLVLEFMVLGAVHALKMPLLGLLSTTSNLNNVGRALFGLDPAPHSAPAWLAALAVAAIGALGYWIIQHRVAKAETAGLGGG